MHYDMTYSSNQFLYATSSWRSVSFVTKREIDGDFGGDGFISSSCQIHKLDLSTLVLFFLFFVFFLRLH